MLLEKGIICEWSVKVRNFENTSPIVKLIIPTAQIMCQLVFVWASSWDSLGVTLPVVHPSLDTFIPRIYISCGDHSTSYVPSLDD